jgi:hypothetical protein
MPNWCDNTISISGPAEKLSPIFTKLKEDGKDGLCQILHPMPENTFTGNLGQKEREQCAEDNIPNWYDWCSSNWGTKWDTCDGDWNYEDAGDGQAILTGSFQSAWAPPVGVYEHSADAHPDLHIEAMYYEPGCAYTLSIECASEGNADLGAVENLLDLHFQDLVMDDTFVNELDEGQAVTIQVVPNFGKK